MTSRDFCYWLQGFFELRGRTPAPMTAEQVEMVRCHLALVFKHEIDPSAGDEKHQSALNEIHDPPSPSHHPHIGGFGPGGAVYRC